MEANEDLNNEGFPLRHSNKIVGSVVVAVVGRLCTFMDIRRGKFMRRSLNVPGISFWED